MDNDTLVRCIDTFTMKVARGWQVYGKQKGLPTLAKPLPNPWQPLAK